MTDLPMGWQERTPDGIFPLDAGTPPEEWENTAHPRYPRVELNRWSRGRRYVRVCRAAKNSKGDDVVLFFVHYGWFPAEDSWYSGLDTHQEALKVAHKLMRWGGCP